MLQSLAEQVFLSIIEKGGEGGGLEEPAWEFKGSAMLQHGNGKGPAPGLPPLNRKGPPPDLCPRRVKVVPGKIC